MTDFTEIYNRAILYFSDYDFIGIDTDKRDEILRGYLTSAVADFSYSSQTNLSVDADIQAFNNDLTEQEKEILALGVAVKWVDHKALNSELLHNTMTRTDYNTYSPANLLKEVTSLRDSLRKQFRLKMNEYSYRNSGIENLKVDRGE